MRFKIMRLPCRIDLPGILLRSCDAKVDAAGPVFRFAAEAPPVGLRVAFHFRFSLDFGVRVPSVRSWIVKRVRRDSGKHTDNITCGAVSPTSLSKH